MAKLGRVVCKQGPYKDAKMGLHFGKRVSRLSIEIHARAGEPNRLVKLKAKRRGADFECT